MSNDGKFRMAFKMPGDDGQVLRFETDLIMAGPLNSVEACDKLARELSLYAQESIRSLLVEDLFKRKGNPPGVNIPSRCKDCGTYLTEANTKNGTAPLCQSCYTFSGLVKGYKASKAVNNDG